MSTRAADPFRDFEHRQWEAAHAHYEAAFSSLTRQSIPHVLEVLQLNAGHRVLDIACGPGHFTAAAARAVGANCALGVDFSLQMIRIARQNYPELTFDVADAECLEAIPTDSCDAVALNYGIMHLAHPESALREMQRVLKPGRRAAFTVWRPPQEAPGFDIIRQAIQQYGDPAIPLPPAPDMFHYSDPDRCIDLLTACGFNEPRVQFISQIWRLHSPSELFDAYLHGSARTGGLLQRQTADQLDRIRSAVEARAADFTEDGGIAIPMPAQIAWATKP